MALREFTDSANRTAWVDDRGYVFTENGKNPTYYTRAEWDERQLNRWGTPEEQQINKLDDEITNVIIEYEDKLSGLGLTQKEMDTFLQKAIDEITPYYDTKKAEIEAGIKEGKVQAAEDILIDIRRIREEVGTALQKLDIDQAQTEEEFVNTLADITSTREEDIATKRYTWGERIKELKQTQVQTGILTSGIGKKEVGGLESRQQAEEAAVARSAGAKQTALETGQKFDLERISLARQAVQTQRERQLGTPEQETATTTGALGTLGLSNMSSLTSEAELARQRAERNIKVEMPSKLTGIEEERSKAVESRKLTLQAEEEAAQRQRIIAERNKKLTSLGAKYPNIGVY